MGRYASVEQRSPSLSDLDWDFAELGVSERQYGVHFFHQYAAKFIPQIPATIISELSKPNDIVVDPFMGAGTTLVEAALQNRRSYGLDTNPLAVKIAQAKTLRVDANTIAQIDGFLEWLATRKRLKEKSTGPVENPGLFEGSHLWFRADVAHKISDILDHRESCTPHVRNFIEVALSDLLKGMSNARMDSVEPTLPSEPTYIDRKHYYRAVNNLTRDIPVYRRVHSQLAAMRRAILEFNQQTDADLTCSPNLADSRHLSSVIGHCDLVVTSPPYWTAQNYEKLHMLSFRLFGLQTKTGEEIGRNGSTYLTDMEQVLREISKILSGHMAIVIGEDEKSKQHERLFEIAKEVGFVPRDVITRNVSNQTSVAKQIKKEFIYVFRI